MDLDELASERWISATPKGNEMLLGAWEWGEWIPQVAFIAREWTAKLGLVAAGLGVTLFPGLAADAVRPDISLVRIRSERPATRAVLVATRAGDLAPPVAELRELMHETASELLAQLQQRIGTTVRR